MDISEQDDTHCRICNADSEIQRDAKTLSMSGLPPDFYRRSASAPRPLFLAHHLYLRLSVRWARYLVLIDSYGLTDVLRHQCTLAGRTVAGPSRISHVHCHI